MSDIYKMNTCYPARILSFDPVKQVASCKLSIESYYTGIDFSYEKLPAVELVDVPVQFPQGGGWDITFPIKEGDRCLVLFAQRGYDHWLYGAKDEAGLHNGIPAADFSRCFSARDAIIIMGVRPIPEAIPSFQSEDMEIRNEARTQRITLKANGDIEVDTTANVKVNCNNAIVQANQDSIITCKNSEVTASAGAQITAPQVVLDTPLTKCTGSLQVGGTISVAGAARAGISTINGIFKLIGSMDATGDVVAQGKSLATHTHISNGQGNPTNPPS